MAPEGGRGTVAPSSGSVSPFPWGKNFVPVGEFLTENCVLMHRKIPSILLFSPPVLGTQHPSGKSWRHPWKNGNHVLQKVYFSG